jgi:acyl-coenzyme A synthetase/AMP-(fatty) acid ligase/thioesterase domain-containing protein
MNHCLYPVDPTLPLPFDAAELDGTLDGRLRRVAAWLPDHPALIHDAGQLTFGELDARTDRLAAAIQAACGTGPDCIALLLPHGYLDIVGVYAALKAGKRFVALDTSRGVAAAQRVWQVSQAQLLLTVRDLLPAARAVMGDAARLLVMEAVPATPACPQPTPRTGQSPACMLATSGTTGEPKLVVYTHGMLLWRCRHTVIADRVTPSERITHLVHYSAVLSYQSVFHALLNGLTLVGADPRTMDAARLDAWLRAHRIAVMVAAPAFLRQYWAWLPPGGAPPTLRLVRVAGQAILGRDVEAWRRAFPRPPVGAETNGTKLVIVYGSTEVISASRYVINYDTPIKTPTVPIGYALDGRRVMILGEAQRPLPPGEVGEIAVQGTFLPDGYWGDAELSNRKVLRDPATGAVTWLTGDLGRVQPDGLLEYLGRKDTQVKVRGYRVEVGAVEKALLEVAGVVDAAVISRPTPTGDTQLVGYLLSAPDAHLTASSLRRALLAQLPDYMVPAVFVRMDAFPLTHSGKIDRLRLPTPDGTRPELDVPYLPPRTPLETRLAALWAKLLQIDRVGLYDNLFDLGSNSLVAAQAVAALREELGIALPLRYIFDGPTVAELAARVSVEQEQRRPVLLPGVTTLRGGDGAPLFVVPGGNGGEEELLLFARLAHEMGLTRPLHGLLACGPDAAATCYASVAALAEVYVAAVRRVQPQGSYWVLGECIGGSVAFEVARRLLAGGATVAQLILMDARLPSPGGGAASTQPAGAAAMVGRQIAAWWGRLRYQAAHTPPRSCAALLAAKLRRQAARLGESPERMARRLVANATYRELATHYRPAEPYMGDVIFLMSAEWAAEGLLARWQPLLTGRVHTIVVPGCHNDYLGAHVRTTAVALAARLRDLQGAPIS